MRSFPGRKFTNLSFSILLVAVTAYASDPTGRKPEPAAATDASASSSSYVLGPEDSLTIRVLDADELAEDPYPIDLNGDINLPRIGTVHAQGLTVQELQRRLTERYKEYLQNPAVTVSVAEYHSQPVSVLGSIDSPGVHQIRGRKTLFEVISEAGGLKDDAGNTIKITRRKEWGPIPLPNATSTPGSEFYVAEVDVHSVMEARNPQANIPVKPYDVITVPKAELVYVVGAVKRAGGFALSEKASISVLQALSLAEGLERNAGPSKAQILRPMPGSVSKTTIPVDVSSMLKGKLSDVPLQANDILFIPNNAAKTASLRAIEAVIQTGTGFAIYHPF